MNDLSGIPPIENSVVAPRLAWWRWPLESLRASLLIAPRVGAAQPTPWQVAASFLLSFLATAAIDRASIAGPAVFLWRNSLISLWDNLLFIWLGWLTLYPKSMNTTAAQPAPALRGLASWLALTLWIGLPARLVSVLHGVAWREEWLSLPSPSLFYLMWGIYLMLVAWTLAALFRLTARYLASRRRLLGFMAASIALYAVLAWQFQYSFWEPVRPAKDSESTKRPAYLRLTQRMFEQQQTLVRNQQTQLAAERPGVIDVYGLIFAPYAGEEVFRNESAMVAEVMRQRFDAEGRILQYLNHAETGYTLPWATPENLQRGIAAIAARMDRQHDVLMIYLTSHGASDFKLAARNWPLEVDPLTPELLRRALDEAGIRNRALIVSACYSGGWIEALAGETTLVMTAADAEHTSYGCGSRSDLTYFGRALFDEQLRRTRSFPAAFAQARTDIEKRENEAGKDDGFSNPQISLGEGIAPALDALAKRLDAADKEKAAIQSGP